MDDDKLYVSIAKVNESRRIHVSKIPFKFGMHQRFHHSTQEDCTESIKGNSTQSQYYLLNGSRKATEIMIKAPVVGPGSKRPSS